MRIGIDCRELKKGVLTGIGRYLQNFLEYAVATEENHQLILYGNQNSHIPFSGANVTVRILPEYNTFGWDNFQLPQALLKDKVRLFFSPYEKAPLWSPVKTIITIHDLLFLYFPGQEYKSKKIYNFIYRKIRKISARQADRIITVSEFSKSDIIATYKIDPSKIRVIPNGVSPAFHPHIDDQTVQAIRTKYRIKDEFFLYVGNFKPHKNVHMLIRAYAQLADDIISQYQLVLCGKRDRYTDTLEDEVSDRNLDHRVIFTDMVPDEELPVLYNGAQLFIFPSLYEGSGFPPLEAMACGTPVIASNRTSLPEVVADAGVLVDPTEAGNITRAIEELLADQNLYQKFQEKGLARAKQFSTANSARLIMETLESCST